MTANDYHVIVYQILAYLYECLKEGRDVSLAALSRFRRDIPINDRYWQYILRHLVEERLIENVKYVPVMNSRVKQLDFTESTTITPFGISFLTEEPMMKKVCDVLLDGAKTVATSVISTYVSSKL